MSKRKRCYEFTLILSGFSELTDDALDALYESGCGDGLVCLDKDGVPFIEFSREADSLEAAIRSAVSDVEEASFRVVRAEVESTKTT